jgi:hypothetical protein
MSDEEDPFAAMAAMLDGGAPEEDEAEAEQEQEEEEEEEEEDVDEDFAALQAMLDGGAGPEEQEVNAIGRYFSVRSPDHSYYIVDLVASHPAGGGRSIFGRPIQVSGVVVHDDGARLWRDAVCGLQGAGWQENDVDGGECD